MLISPPHTSPSRGEGALPYLLLLHSVDPHASLTQWAQALQVLVDALLDKEAQPTCFPGAHLLFIHTVSQPTNPRRCTR